MVVKIVESFKLEME